jgi:hypothetical protein
VARRVPAHAAVATAVLVVLAGWVPASAQTSSDSVQLDGDPALETVQRVREPCPPGVNAPAIDDACGVIRIVDGARSVAITELTQRPRLNYGWVPAKPVLRDLTGDGRAEIVWQLDTSGGTGSSPRLVGVHSWTGERAVRLFSTSGLTRDALPIRLDVLPPRRGLRELRLVELLYGRDDATCCPGRRRTRRYRFDGTRMKPVPGSTRVTRLRS